MKKSFFYVIFFLIILIILLYPQKPFKTIDTFSGRLTSISLVVEKNFELNEFYGYPDSYLIEKVKEFNETYVKEEINGKTYFHPWIITVQNNHFYSSYPLVVSILNFPFYWIASFFYDFKKIHINDLNIPSHFTYKLDNFISSFWVALSAILMFYLIEKKFNRKFAYLITLIYVFLTPNFSLLSHNTWQHTIIVFIVIWILILIEAEKKWSHFFLGVLIGLLFFIRPTTIVFYILLLNNFKKIKWKFILLGYILISIPLLYLHISIYNHILGPYYHHFKMNSHLLDSKFSFENFFNILFSPSRGHFIFMPYLMIIFIGNIYLILKKQKYNLIIFFIPFVAYLFYYSSYPLWHGGWNYGPRFFSDLLPLFMLQTAHFFYNIKNHLLNYFLLIFFLFAFFIHIQPAMNDEFHKWESCYIHPQGHVEKIKDWNYPVWLATPKKFELFWKEEGTYNLRHLCFLNQVAQIKEDFSVYFDQKSLEKITSEIPILTSNFVLISNNNNFYLPKGKFKIILNSEPKLSLINLKSTNIKILEQKDQEILFELEKPSKILVQIFLKNITDFTFYNIKIKKISS